MKYCVDPLADEPIMSLLEHIGWDDEDGQGIDGALFTRELLQLDSMGKKRIEVWINSVGGVVLDAYSIYNAILNTKTPVDTFNVGMAASSAGFIWMAGRRRYMADYAIFMMHNPFSPTGDASDKVLTAMATSTCKMLANRNGVSVSEEDVSKMMNDTTYLDMDECYSMGFCTHKVETKSENAKYMPAMTDVKARWKESGKIAASLLNTSNNSQNTTSMRKVTGKLNLNEGSNEDLIVDAIEKIQDKAAQDSVALSRARDEHRAEILNITNKHSTDKQALEGEVTTAKAEVVNVKNELTGVQAKLTAKETELTEVKAKLEAMENEKKEAETAAKKVAAEALVAEHVRTGRIKNEAKIIARWTENAIEDFDGTKELIEAMPLGKVAPVIDKIEASGDAHKIMGSAEFKMQQIAAKNKLAKA